MAATKEAESLGAKFVCGNPQGKVTELVMNQDGDVKGAKTADGEQHMGDRKSEGYVFPKFIDSLTPQQTPSSAQAQMLISYWT